MSSRDNEIMEKRLTKQKELFESQLSELRAEKVQVCHHPQFNYPRLY